MKKGLLGAVATTALIWVSCSSDEEMANIETATRNTIGFNVAANSIEVKASPIFDNSYFKKTDLDVFAYYSESRALYLGNEAGNDGIDIVYKNSKWDYNNSLDRVYWPTKKTELLCHLPRNDCRSKSRQLQLAYSRT